ncbi:MAG TPA: hypothetical protein VMU84_10730 [Thermoanaerobaculia bacterium]|nr:hypothetical protein [Thermoanaerobaculia bacterium]
MILSEDRIPLDGIEERVAQLGSDLASRGVRCAVSWSAENDHATVTLTCERDKRRVSLLIIAIIGALLFMIWPFVPGERLYGTLAWIGGAIAIGAWLLSLRATSAGIAYDRLQEFANQQRR